MVEIKHDDLFKSCSTLNVHTGGITTLMLATRGRGSGSEEIKKNKQGTGVLCKSD